jgi:site-specific DNA recombinase
LRNNAASVCKFGRKYHPDTGEKFVFSTEADAEAMIFEELRIIPQVLWDAVQKEITGRAERAVAAGNPHRARRPKHLLSGFMICGCCGQTYVKVGQKRFGCREARKRSLR